MYTKYECSISCGSKVMAKFKVDNRQDKKQYSRSFDTIVYNVIYIGEPILYIIRQCHWPQHARKRERGLITFVWSQSIPSWVIKALVWRLASAPIVETKFIELAMSLLDFSPRIPLGTFSILLQSPCTVPRSLRQRVLMLPIYPNQKDHYSQ